MRAELREPRLALLQLRAEHEAAAALCLKVGLRSCRASVRGAGRPPHAGRRRATPTLTLTLTLTLALAIAFEARGGAPLNGHVAVEPELHEVGLQVGVRHVQQHLYGARDRSLSARAEGAACRGAGAYRGGAFVLEAGIPQHIVPNRLAALIKRLRTVRVVAPGFPTPQVRHPLTLLAVGLRRSGIRNERRWGTRRRQQGFRSTPSP